MIAGGGNFMSTQSFAEAVAGALDRGEPGKAYLVGDENWSFVHYYELILETLGMPQTLAVRDASHPSFPDESLYSGRGIVIAYEPDPVSVQKLGYRRHDAERAVRDMVPYYRRLIEK
jgi:dihydroflavonol-4-reductase